jgi:hypothetical protein
MIDSVIQYRHVLCLKNNFGSQERKIREDAAVVWSDRTESRPQFYHFQLEMPQFLHLTNAVHIIPLIIFGGLS